MMASREANIWLTVAAVLFVVLMAWLWNSRLAGMVSGAAGLQFGQTKVWITNEFDKEQQDFISAAPGSVIKVGFRSIGVKSCSPSWQNVGSDTRYLAPTNYSVTGNATLTVTCLGRKGAEVKDTLQINAGSSTTGDFSVYKPTASDTWELGKTYEIAWKSSGIKCQPQDLGCDAQPIDDLKGRCDNPSGDCSSRDVINCVKAPCTNPADTVTITLNAEEPACLHQEPRCYIKQTAPYVISEKAPNTGTFSWTVPTSLPEVYQGRQQVTVTLNTTGAQGKSAVFTVGRSTGQGGAITVTSPNGGENWIVGESKPIRWESAKLSGTATIELLEFRDCSQACTARVDRRYTLGSKVSNSGTFNWTVGTAVSTDVTPGQYYVLVTDSAGNSDQSDRPFTVAAKASTQNSGIEGRIYSGPTCGGAIQDNGKCADKPYQTTINVKSTSGTLVTTFNSDASGAFRVSLAPGTYVLSKASTAKLPSLNPETVTVKSGVYTSVNLVFDTGIR
jgi:hypothetical protein